MLLPTTIIIQDAWLKISAASAVHQYLWPCNKTIFQAIKACYTSLSNAVILKRKAVNAAIVPLAGQFNKTNIQGFHHAQFTTLCPYDVPKRRRVHYYYRYVHNKPPSIPNNAPDVEGIVARSNRVIKDWERITSEEKKRINNGNVEKATEGTEADNKEKKQSAK